MNYCPKVMEKVDLVIPNQFQEEGYTKLLFEPLSAVNVERCYKAVGENPAIVGSSF